MEGRAIECITSTDPERVNVRLLPHEQMPKEATPHRDGPMIERFAVVVTGKTVGDIKWPKSCAASECVVACGKAPSWRDTSRPASRICAPKCWR